MSEELFLVKVGNGGIAPDVVGASCREFCARSLAKQMLRYEKYRTAIVQKIRDGGMYSSAERACWECVAEFERDEYNRVVEILGRVDKFIEEEQI